MKVKNTFVEGFRSVFYNKRYVALLWCTNAAMAFILAIPIYTNLIDNLKHSVMSDKLAQGWDFVWYLQFRQIYQNEFHELPLLIYGVTGVYVLILTFYSGGFISIFHFPKKNHVSDFFYGGVKYWYRFTKVLLVSLGFYALVFKFHALSGDWIHYGYSNSENVLADFVLRSLRYLVLLFLIGVIGIISDYTKVLIAIEDRADVFKCIVAGIRFIKRNFNIVFGVFLLVSIMGAGGAVVYNIVAKYVPKAPFYFLLLSFILQQMLIIFRLLIRMLFFSTEVYLYKDLSADVVSAKAYEQKTGVNI